MLGAERGALPPREMIGSSSCCEPRAVLQLPREFPALRCALHSQRWAELLMPRVSQDVYSVRLAEDE